MQYLVKLVVYTGEASSFESRVRAAIERSGGAVRQSESTTTSSGTREQFVTFLIPDTQILPKVVRAVEAIRGAAVMAVTEPRPFRDLRSV